jgi:hypothetical protein
MVEKLKINTEMRIWFIGPILMLWGGIFFTGFEVVYWLVYIPATFALFAFLTGLCPGMLLIRTLLGVFKNTGNKR